jgi:hypothetical protein
MAFRFGIAGVAVAVLASGQAQAQSAQVDQAFLSASCSGAAFSCAFNVQQTIATLRQSGLSPAALNAQIGRIAAIVSAQVTASMPSAARARVAEALTVAADNSTDPAQQAGIQQAATVIATSEEGTFVSLPPLEGSPT